MGLGQTMLTSLFLVLLTVAVMTANKMIVDQDSNYYQHRALEQASILASALLDEISTKAYDDQAITYPDVYLPRNMFNSALGPNPTAKNYVNPSGKPDSVTTTRSFKSIRKSSAAYFDDIDDYKGYYRLANSSDFTGFQLTVNVYYVSESNPSMPSAFQTYLKKVDVNVQHTQYLKKGVTFSRVIAY